jgi:acetolactate synthase-1/2/3 large subunit
MNQALPHDSATTVATESVAEAFLVLLKDRGVDCLYVGAGTDTAPIIEAYARAERGGLALPRPIVAVHENLAVGMAHGYYMVTQRPQALMLHTSVGTANAVCNLMNAVRAQVPLLLTAGRTPWFEEGRLGSRTHEVHWAQEMFDQAGMVRELVKWDYELRDGINLAEVIDRAIGIAMAEPRGPIYLTLPRETLAQRKDECRLGSTVAIPSSPHPDPAAVEALARALMAAEFPAVLSTACGADPRSVPLLVELADRFGIGTCEGRPRYLCFPSSHPLHLGHELAALFAETDALLVLDTDVPWTPSVASPRPGTFIAQAGPDPLHSRIPIRSFRADLNITASSAALLPSLMQALDRLGAAGQAAARREKAQAFGDAARRRAAARAKQDEDAGGPITKLFFSRMLSEAKPADAIVVNEYSALREQMRFDEPGSFFQLPSSGGLGWGLPAALGAKQALPGRTVISVVGDGAYLFANPAACHQASAMHELPVLTLVYNNECWDAVAKTTTGMYPRSHAQQHAKEHGLPPLSSLKPLPDFERYPQASGGYGERVTERAQLLPAIRRALHAVQVEGRQALLNVLGV